MMQTMNVEKVMPSGGGLFPEAKLKVNEVNETLFLSPRCHVSLSRVWKLEEAKREMTCFLLNGQIMHMSSETHGHTWRHGIDINKHMYPVSDKNV